MGKSCVAFMALMVLFAVQSAIVMAVFLYYATKVFIMYGCSDRWLTIYLTLLFVSLCSNISFGVMEVAERVGGWEAEVDRCSYIAFYWMNYVFYMLAVMVNMFNWVLQIHKLNAKIRGSQHTSTKTWILMISLIIVFLLVFFGYLAYGCSNDKRFDSMTPFYGILFSVSYFIIGIWFAFFGYLFYQKYKIVFPQQAKLSKFRITMSLSVIWGLFLFRATSVISRVPNDYVIRFRNANIGEFVYAMYNYLYFTLVSLVPTVVQIMMLHYLILQGGFKSSGYTTQTFIDRAESCNSRLIESCNSAPDNVTDSDADS